jgi:cytochrome P450
MGLPVEELDQFLAWEAGILHGDNSTAEGRELAGRSMMEVIGYFAQLVEQRRADPRDDIVSRALTFDLDGRPPTHEELMAFCLLMFMAGLDTVTQNLNYAMWHLASTPSDRERIVADPGLIPGAVEEVVRAFAIVIAARKATEDTVVAGCPVRKGQMIAVSLASANRDEELFADGTQIRIDRSPNNHIGFGAGPHRCLGSHLARREMKIALEEWHRRIPSYRLADGSPPVEHGGMYGLSSVRLVWDA